MPAEGWPGRGLCLGDSSRRFLIRLFKGNTGQLFQGLVPGHVDGAGSLVTGDGCGPKVFDGLTPLQCSGEGAGRGVLGIDLQGPLALLQRATVPPVAFVGPCQVQVLLDSVLGLVDLDIDLGQRA